MMGGGEEEGESEEGVNVEGSWGMDEKKYREI